MTRGISGTALVTAAAVLMGLVQAVPVAADTPPEEDTGSYRNSIGQEQRIDRCLTGVALHYGGANMKAKAVEGLTGTAGELRAVVGNIGWIGFGPLGQARAADSEAAGDYLDASRARAAALESANKPYASSAFYSEEMKWHIPEFDAEVLQFTLFKQSELSGRLGWDGHSNASPEAIARAREIREENDGKDSWHDWAAAFMLADEEVNNVSYVRGTTASDVASYLRYGGFLTEAPAEGSAEYRVLVEGLKQAWAACDSQNPVDIRRVLNGPVMTAMAEWEVEYASQSTPRATIIQAEVDAAAATRAATDDMIQAIQQAWRADQILTWQKVVAEELANDPESLFAPEPELYEQAEADLADARAKADAFVTSANSHAEAATAASERATAAQQEAWAIADATNVPRGRGLMYAQQSVQVARASAAATEAAAKATETARDAINATVGDSRTLLARAQTETHALNTEFRRVAAQEAAAQAKAAADSAEANAQAAADSAAAAETAEDTAKEKQETARQKAADAQTQRATAELEYATAVAARATAAEERVKAAEAGTRAESQRTTANTAKDTAETAASDAAGKRKTADEKASAAQAAREKAVAAELKQQATAARAAALAAAAAAAEGTAELKQQATAARAAALEAAAAAAEGTAAAAETRQAADQAQQAATQAAEAAATARAAADDATAAAVSARAAATKAEGAAARAQAAANAAWSAYLGSTGAAATAHVEAAKALDAAQTAALRAKNAASASEQASKLAERAGAEAASAGVEAARAVESVAVVAGRAYAAGQAALAARDSATKAVAAAADAIAIGTPYQETDSAAAFAVLTGQSAKTMAEQQAAAAEAKAAEAEQAALDAQQLAKQAEGDAKIAAEAAAQAATDSVRATEAVSRAQASTQAATKAREGAKRAADSASDYAQQAGVDALSAQQTANKTDSVAVEADREATDAERDALRAGEVADRATKDATEAQSQADKAEQDAQDAEARAADAEGDGTAAEEAAKKAEQEQRKRNEEERRKAMEEGNYPIPGGPSSWPELGEQQEAILLEKCGQSCVDDYRKALAAVSVDVLEWTEANGGQILLDELGVAKVKKCLGYTGVENCLWSLVDVAASAAIVGRIPAITAAIEQVSTGIQQVFIDADNGQRRLTELTELISKVRSTPRLEQCVAGVALHAGGANMKAKAIEGLSGTADQLHAVVGNIGWISLGPLGQARDQDRAAAFAYRDASAARKTKLEDANRPYALSSFSDEISLHAPEFDKDVLQFTLFTQAELAGRLGWDGHSNASAEAVARAKEITKENDGKDSWNDFAAALMLSESHLNNTRFSGGTTASDIASYLRHGGFPSEAPAADSAEFRFEVENLKQAWSSCDHQDPVDPRNVFAAVVSQATAEWNAEYAAQATPRATIIQAEADAAAATRVATDNMIEAIGQAWLAEQILLWQKYWHDTLKADPNSIHKPKQALFDQADADLARARGKVVALATSAQQQAAAASAAATRAVTAQQQAYDIADADQVPRGRGLVYAQQSVQVARASGAAAQAAAKATETALNAANATVSDTKALLALAQTEAHAVNTEFRRIAAQEAAAQAKAAADSADKQAAEAEKNAKTAKAAQATAEKEEERARQAAATARSQRAIAELERANAAAARATAEQERAKAGAAEARALEEQGRASSARSKADTAGATAASKRAVAEEAEAQARLARDRAIVAEREEQAAKARAAATEAAAAAAEGTEAAAETREAANEARAAASEATAAANRARAAANQATDAAVAARAAATQAQGAAERSRAAAEAAWSAYLTAAGSAASARAAAAEAIDAAEAAAQNAKNAEADSKKASEAAAVAKEEAEGAKKEAAQTAAWAARTAGHAYATAIAATAARDTATQVVKPANEAIAIGTPYQETDVAAAFAVLTGQRALSLSEQQAAAAEAKAVEAAGFATEAQRLAEQAAGDAKLAAEAAAAAAKDAERAARAVQRAQTSAKEAEKAAKAAQKAANNASQYAQQAGTDAFYAGFAANEAESDAAAADREATEAEKDADSARTAATKAEKDAAGARATAAQAEKDATAAEAAAANAHGLAEEANAAAVRAEAAERERLRQERAAHVEAGSLYDGPHLADDDAALLLQICGQTCVDEYNAMRDLAAGDIIEWVKANGGEILLEVFGVANIKACLSTWEFESCMWALVEAGVIVIAVAKIPAVAKALYRVSRGINAFLDSSKVAKRSVEKYQSIMEKVRKAPASCVTQKSPMQRAALLTVSSTSSFGGWKIPGLCMAVEITDWFFDDIRDYHFLGGSKFTPDKGVWNASTSNSRLKEIFEKAETMCGDSDWRQGSEPAYFVCTFDPGFGIVGQKKKDGADTSLVEVVVSRFGDSITMYPK